MSLNGLDDAKVKEAHDTAAVEPGGWFSLKYISRDEVELLGRGNGGIVEIRNAIAGYEEPSPLFGFLRYRRRNVLIKYVPEDCSRLVQARVTVHFSAVQERFAPIDTEFSIAHSKELKDSTLSAACSLHTASGSTSSSTSSLRRRRLMEIAEEEEETRKRQSIVVEERPTAPDPMPENITTSASAPPLPLSLSTIKSSNLDTEPPPPRSPTRASMDGPPLSRKSTSSARPDIHSYGSHGSQGRPKVKLAPRPSFDVAGNKRPQSSSAASHYRPVSTLPVGLKIFSSKSPRKHPPNDPPSMTIAPPPAPDSPHSAPSRPHTSGGNGLATPSPSIAVRPASIAPKTPTMTPEKARLMKALELRKKQMSSPPANVEPLSPSSSEGLTSPNGPSKDVQDTLAMLNDMAKKDDSGIAFDAKSTLKTDESDATRSDSYPVSPVGPSERAESTKASSVSESTDETIQESKREIADQEARETPPQVDSGETEATAAVVSQDEEASTAKTEEDYTLLPTVYEHPLSGSPMEGASEMPQESEHPTPIIAPAEVGALVPETREAVIADASITTEPAKAITIEIEEATPVAIPSEPVVEKAENAPAPISPVMEDQIPRSKFAQPEIKIPQEEAKPELSPQETPDSESPTQSKTKELKIPRSKFSMQNIKVNDDTPEVPSEPLHPAATTTMSQKSPIESTFSVDSKRSYTEEDKENNGRASPKKRKTRKGAIEPIRTDFDVADISGHNTDVHLSSDDDLMDELDSAVVQEAKPISVSRSPISATFPQPSIPKKRDSWRNKISRVTSNPIANLESASFLGIPKKTETSRSVSTSAAFLNQNNQDYGKPLAKKVNVGSGISQRIKALEKLSSSPGAADPSAISAPSAPAFFSVKKARGTSPSIADRANSLNRNTPTPTGLKDPSRESSPETFQIRDRSESLKSRKSLFESPSFSRNPNTETTRPRVESISVTARIIRDPAQPFPTAPTKDPSEYARLDLKQSPLVINHKQSDAMPPIPKETIQERRQSRERRLSSSSNATNTTTTKRRSSITIVKDLINEGRSSFSERRKSGEFMKSVSSPSVRSPRPPSAHTSPAGAAFKRSSSRSSRHSNDGRTPDVLSPPPTAQSNSSASDEQEKKGSRGSRLLHRMSNSFSSGRKAISHAMSPTVREDPEPVIDLQSSSSRVSLATSTPSLEIGDVNVQFPDTLLWKRRSMLIDSSGFLILSAALATTVKGKPPGATTRKLHFSEFRAPSIPDADMQELPNSVVLEFVEASAGGLQIACEDRQGQARILEALQDAHKRHA